MCTKWDEIKGKYAFDEGKHAVDASRRSGEEESTVFVYNAYDGLRQKRGMMPTSFSIVTMSSLR